MILDVASGRKLQKISSLNFVTFLIVLRQKSIGTKRAGKMDSTRTKLLKLAVVCVICLGLVVGLGLFIQWVIS